MGEKIDFSHVSFLIVDGDRVSSQIVYDTVAYLGATMIQRTRDPHEALQILRQAPVDVIVTEWKLKGMDGLKFLDILRNSAKSPNRFVPVIMLTAHSEQKYVTAARDLGITEFLAKPFNARSLYMRLASVIARPRNFINSDTYFGPDRRRSQQPYDGRDRRKRLPRTNGH